MRVTRWGEYGILCCMYLAKNTNRSPIGASEIAESQSIPLQYAQQILHRLRRGQIIKSTRGPHGGFFLTRSPQDTNLRDILYAAEGATFEVVCDTDPIYPHRCHSDYECGLKNVWHEMKSAVDDLLQHKTLAMMLEKPSPQDALVPAPRAAKMPR